MLNRIKLLAITAPSLFVLPVFAFAQITNPLGDGTTLASFLDELLGIVIIIAVPIILVMIVYAGYLFVTAGGNTDKLTTAKKTLMYALIGATIILGARIIASGVRATVEDIQG